MRQSFDAEVSAYIGSLNDIHKAMIDWIIERMFKINPAFDSKMRWGQINFTLENDWHHWICALYSTKAYVSLNFHKGSLIPDLYSLLQGSGQYSRTIRFATLDDIEGEMIDYYLRAAIDKQREL